MKINYFENQLLSQAQSLLRWVEYNFYPKNIPIRIEDFRWGDLYLRLTNLDQQSNNLNFYPKPACPIQVYHNLQVLEIVFGQMQICVDTVLFFDPYKSSPMLFEALSNIIRKISTKIFDSYFFMKNTLATMKTQMGDEKTQANKIEEIQILLGSVVEIRNSPQQPNNTLNSQKVEKEYDYEDIFSKLTSSQSQIIQEQSKRFLEQQFQFPKENKPIKKGQNKKYQQSNNNLQGCQVLGEQLVQFQDLYEGYLQYKNNFYFLCSQRNQKIMTIFNQEPNLFSYSGPYLFSHQQSENSKDQESQSVKQQKKKQRKISNLEVNQQFQSNQNSGISNQQIFQNQQFQQQTTTNIIGRIIQQPPITTVNIQQPLKQSQNSSQEISNQQSTLRINEQKSMNKPIESGKQNNQNLFTNQEQLQNQNEKKIDEKQITQQVDKSNKLVTYQQNQLFPQQKLNQSDQNTQLLQKSSQQAEQVIAEEIFNEQQNIQPSKMLDIFNIAGQKQENEIDIKVEVTQDDKPIEPIKQQNINQDEKSSAFKSKDFGEFNLFTSFGLDQQKSNINEATQGTQNQNKKENEKQTHGQVLDNQHIMFYEKFNKNKHKDKIRSESKNGSKKFQNTTMPRITDESIKNINPKPSQQGDETQITRSSGISKQNPKE
ncbi:hypothetical protein pb186bvf_003921 [Paramecium bursaria]